MGTLERQIQRFPAGILVALLLPLLYLPSFFLVFWFCLIGAVFFVSIVLFIRLRSVRLAILVSTAFLGGVVILCHQADTDLKILPFDVVGQCKGAGTVVAEAPINSQGNSRFAIEVEEIETNGWKGRARFRATVLGFHGQSLPCGSRVRWEGRVAPDEGTTGQLVIFWTAGSTVDTGGPFWEVRSRVRAVLFTSLERLDPASAALGEALLIGDTDNLTPDEKNSFRDAGASHVLALSGMHLGLLSLVLTSLLGRFLSPRTTFFITTLLLLFFCFVAGPIPSLLRALSMTVLAGIARLAGRPVTAMDLLLQSFFLTVVVWPETARTLSLGLSFLSLAGLFLWGKQLEYFWRPFFGRFLGESLGSACAATLATLPLTSVCFHVVRWVGILSSAPLVVLTTVYIELTFVYVILCAFFPAIPWEVTEGVFRFLYQTIFLCTRVGAAAPALDWQIVFPVFLGGLFGAGLFLYNKRHRRRTMPRLNYDSPTDLQEFLTSRGFNALKRWGQNFLINKGARLKILEALELKVGEPVWEVGPGLGALTHHLVEKGHPLTVFEIDPGYVAFLREEFGTSASGFRILEGDVLKTWRHARSDSEISCVKTVGNLPYNAASAIIADFIEGGFFPEIFVVTVQKEMADRMTAKVGTKNYSSFSVLCQSVFHLKDVVVLKPGSFYPAPEVTSLVVKLVPHGLFPGLDHKRFSQLVRECFSSRRKTLRNNLAGAAVSLNLALETLSEAFVQTGVDLGRRAETLTVQEFVDVYQKLQ